MAKAQTQNEEAPALYVVLESFVIDVAGVPTAYRKGEPVHPDDPVIKSHRQLVGPFAFPHPVHGRRGTLTRPDLRAE